MDPYHQQLKAEVESWVAPDTDVSEKLLRERMRHPGMIKALLLDMLPTHRMNIMEIGGGPLPLSDLLPFRRRIVIDPCTPEYRTIAPCPHHVALTIEELDERFEQADLIIATNSLDHVRDWKLALLKMDRVLKHGGYMAILCAENNATTHPHPSHAINLTAEDIHRQLDENFETVHQLTYAADGLRYGWFPFEGRCGQPAFAWLGRKAIA